MKTVEENVKCKVMRSETRQEEDERRGKVIEIEKKGVKGTRKDIVERRV